MKIFLSFSIFCWWAVVATVAQAERPNIIMFLIDDQNPSSIAAFGGRIPGQIDKQIEIVKQLEIQGKTITVPDALKKTLGVTAEPTPDDKAKRKAERETRRKAREEAKSNKMQPR